MKRALVTILSATVLLGSVQAQAPVDREDNFAKLHQVEMDGKIFVMFRPGTDGTAALDATTLGCNGFEFTFGPEVGAAGVGVVLGDGGQVSLRYAAAEPAIALGTALVPDSIEEPGTRVRVTLDPGVVPFGVKTRTGLPRPGWDGGPTLVRKQTQTSLVLTPKGNLKISQTVWQSRKEGEWVPNGKVKFESITLGD